MPQFLFIRNHAPWHKTLLIPIWILELVFMIAVFALAITGLTQNGNYHNYLYGNAVTYAESNRGATTVLGIDTGFSMTTIVLTFTETLRLANRSLSPALFLVLNLIKLALFIVLVGLDADGIGRGYDRHRVGGVAAIVLDTLAILTILLALLYAILVLVKTRRQLASHYSAGTTEDADKPNPTHRANPVPMTGSTLNTATEPDIAYHHQNRQNGDESYSQMSGIATPSPQYQSYYGTDAAQTPPPRFHELAHVGN